MTDTRYVYPFLLLAVLLGAIVSCGNGSREEQIEDLMENPIDEEINAINEGL